MSGKTKKAKSKTTPPEPNGTPGDSSFKDAPVTEAWGLIHSSRGGDLWHAVRFEIKRNFAKEVERFPATLKIIAAEHIRDNISRFKM